MNFVAKLKQHPWIIPTFIFTILVVVGANMHPLWGDEAETALFARNILKYGVPKGWDGVNLMGLQDAVVLNKDLVNHLTSWGQYYLTAASFFLLGESSFTARLPFILLSIFSLVLIHKLALRLTGDKTVSFVAILISSLSAPFILYSYQARYYSLILFAGLLLVLSALSIKDKKSWPMISFVVAGVLFFYGNYLLFIFFYLSLVIALVFYNHVSLKSIIKLSIVIGLLAALWYFWMKPYENGSNVMPLTLVDYLELELVYIRKPFEAFNNMGFFPIVLFPVLAFFVYKYRKVREKISFLWLLIVLPIVYFLLLTLITPLYAQVTEFVEDRYLIVVFPYLTIVAAYILTEIWKLKRWVGGMVLGVFVFTNLFSFQPPRSYFLDFIKEATMPYPVPDKVVADYLRAHANNGDTAFVSLDRDHEPLVFHLKDKIRFVDRVSITNSRIFPENRTLPRYIYDFRGKPDWVIMYSKMPKVKNYFLFDQRPLPPEVNLARDYTETTLPVLFTDLSRPEIYIHSFVEVVPDSVESVHIYKLKKSNDVGN